MKIKYVTIELHTSKPKRTPRYGIVMSCAGRWVGGVDNLHRILRTSSYHVTKMIEKHEKLQSEKSNA